MPTASPAVAAAPTPAAPGNLARGGRQGCCSFSQAPQVPKGSAHALGGNGHLSLLRCHGRRLLDGLRSTSCARCPASSRRRSTSLGRPMICRRLRRARTGQHVQAHVLGRVLGQLRAEGLRGCEPRSPEVRCADGRPGRSGL